MNNIAHVQELLQLASDSSSLTLWDWDIGSGAVRLSEAWSLMVEEGSKAATTTVTEFTKLLHPSEVERLCMALTAPLKGIVPRLEVEHRLRVKAGEWKCVTTGAKVVTRGSDGRALRLVGSFVDITERKRFEEVLRASEERFRLIAEHASDLIAVVDAQGRRLYNSPSYRALFGDELLLPGSDSFEQIHPDDREQVIAIFRDTVATGIGQRTQFRFRLSDGSTRFIEAQGSAIRGSSGEVDRVVVVSRDVTERASAEERLRYLAHHDLLTALPNRLLMHDRFEQALRRAHRDQQWLAILFIDLDDFKDVNDRHGHAVGDRLLGEVALRLKNALRETDSVGRHGGDEFTVLLENLTERAHGVALAEKLLSVFIEPFLLGGHVIKISASIGASLYPDDASDIEGLLGTADAAMYRVKAAGKSGYQFFSFQKRARGDSQ
jgi:diguanylate cyclase (GGDEF)-like protein/PAS domain S-box-containing protein